MFNLFKKTGILQIFAIMSFTLCFPLLVSAVSHTCADTDNNNFYTKGKVSGISTDGKSYELYDYCDGSGAMIKEMVCYESDGGKVYFGLGYTCPFGCLDGACNKKAENSCGNGKIDYYNEACDGALLGDKTCVSKGFAAGTLKCSSDCKLDTSACVESNAIKCSDQLSKIKYLSSFGANDTLESIKDNDAKLKQLLDQTITNKALLNDLAVKQPWTIPLTKDTLFGGCKWLANSNNDSCHIYSYQKNIHLSEEGPCSDTEAQKAAMIKAIKDGYCCVKNDSIEPKQLKPEEILKKEASLVLNSGTDTKYLDALLANTNSKKDTKLQTTNMKAYSNKLNSKYGPYKMKYVYSINNFITYGTASTKKLLADARYSLVENWASSKKALPTSVADWMTAISYSVHDNMGIRDAGRISDVRQIQEALELYFTDAGKYPPTKSIATGKAISFKGNTYMIKVPGNRAPYNDGDCPNKASYSYESTGDNSSYLIYYCLGNGSGYLKPGVNYASPSGIAAIKRN